MRLHVEGPVARRYRRRLAQRRRWELTLLALAIAHWAYHKNHAWNELVTDLGNSTLYPDFSELDPNLDAALPAAVPPDRIDLTSPAEAREGAR